MNNLPKFGMSSYSLTTNVSAQIEESQRQMLKVSEAINQKRREAEEMSMRSLQIQEESLQIQSESNETQKLMLFLMQCLNKDNGEIIQKLGGLINSVEIGNKVVEGNLFFIEKQLEHIKESPDDLQSNFITTAKENLTNKGVDYTIMFILLALKTLFLTPGA